MTEVNRKIHVIGINSYKFDDLSLKLQNLFLETENIAVPNSYFEEIKSWSENGLLKKKSVFSSKSKGNILFKKIFLFDFVIIFIFRIHQRIKSNSCSYNSLISFDYFTIFFYNSR